MESLDYKRIRFNCDFLISEKVQQEAVLQRYELEIPWRVASKKLEATVLEPIYKGERVEAPGDWIPSKIRNPFRRYRVGRRRRLWANFDEAVPGDPLHHAQRS